MVGPLHDTGERVAGGDQGRTLELVLELDPCLNLAMQQNGVPLLKEVTLENLGDVELRDVVVRVVPEPAFASTLELRVATLAAGARQVWNAVALQPSPSFLSGLRERLEGLLHVEVSDGGGTLLVERRSVAVLAYDQWGGLQSLPELLCAFVLPNHPALVAWLRRAAGLLEQWTHDPSFVGYQTRSRDRVLKTAAAVFYALQESGVIYVSPPASFESTGQKVRTADRIQEEKLATCLDLALLTAGCLEQAGLNALVVIVKGHAFVGVWLDETSFPEPSVDDAALLSKRVELGEIAVFDPTLVTSRPACTFEDAIRAAKARFQRPDEFLCGIDVARSRKGGIRPLPLRAHGVELEGRDGTSLPRAPEQAPEIALPRSAAAATGPESPASRIERWKRHLLDLTNRNRLLNFVERKKTVPLECTAVGKLEDLLAESRVLTLRERLSEMENTDPGSRPVPAETVQRLLDVELDASRLVTRLAKEELDTRLTEIFRSAREGLEEGGASGLYVALGFLEWFDSATSDRPRRAPLLLVPVDLQRGSIRQGFKLTRAADETRFNTTLLEMLSTQHHVQIDGVDPLPEDEHGVDVVGVFQQVRSALRDVPRWRVLEEAWLGFFTFAKFLMWKDLDEQSAVLLQNRVVAHLVHQPGCAFDADWREPDYETLDAAHRSADLYCPVLADSSQLAAVIAAADGKSFVLEGPPGTGKSQTITNLIAHCLALGKTVLFVSEKTAALNVVFNRLKAIGLERFCLELHSNKASKLEVIRRLGESLRAGREHSPAGWAALADELDRLRAELNAYASAIGREHKNGLSVFRATSLLTSLREAPSLDLGWQDIGSVEQERLDAARNLLRDARNALGSTGDPHGHALAGVGIEDVPPGLVERIRESFARLGTEIASLASATGAVAQALSVDIETASLRDLRCLAAACRAVIDAPEHGFGLIAGDHRAAEQAVGEVCTLGRERDRLRAALARQFDLRLVELDLLDSRARIREAQNTWALPRWLRTRALRKRLLGVTNAGTTPTLAEMHDAVESALQLKEVDARLALAMTRLREHAGTEWRLDPSPWSEIEAALAWSQRARATITETSADSTPARTCMERLARWVASAGGASALSGQLQASRACLDRCFAAASAVAEVLRLADDDAWRSDTVEGTLGAWRERMERIDSGLSQLRPWALWRRLRSRLVESGLVVLIGALERGSLRGEQLADAFDRSFHEAWLDWARAEEPALRDFLSLSHDQRIERFREVDERCTQLARKVVAAKLSARVPSANAESVPGSELGILQRQLQLQRPKLGPRQLFQKTHTLVQKLKPCFLMSPVSVAQYLPPVSSHSIWWCSTRHRRSRPGTRSGQLPAAIKPSWSVTRSSCLRRVSSMWSWRMSPVSWRRSRSWRAFSMSAVQPMCRRSICAGITAAVTRA